MNAYPETHQQGLMSIENIPQVTVGDKIRADIRELIAPAYFEGDFSVQIAEDGRVWVNINGIAFLRFKPLERS